MSAAPSVSDDPSRAEALASAGRWAAGALIAGGLSALLVPVLACLLLVTMGVAMFLFPVLVPGFLVGFLCALRARSIEGRYGELTSRTRAAFFANAAGLAVSLGLSLIAGGVAAIVYFGR